MLQHLWTGPISNAAVDVVQGSRSVEVRSVGVTKVSGFRYCRCFSPYLASFSFTDHLYSFCRVLLSIVF
jgi:hypothetical protein